MHTACRDGMQGEGEGEGAAPSPLLLTHRCPLRPLPACPPRSYNLFVEMMAQIRRNVIYNVYM